jgi:hypothetical protein
MSLISFAKFLREARTSKSGTFAVMAIDDVSPSWKQGYGHTPELKVVWQMWDLAKNEVGLAANMARKKHPNATISIENQSGRIVKVFKPGVAITEADMTDAEKSERDSLVKDMKEAIKKPWPPGPTDPDDGGDGDGDGNGE